MMDKWSPEKRAPPPSTCRRQRRRRATRCSRTLLLTVPPFPRPKRTTPITKRVATKRVTAAPQELAEATEQLEKLRSGHRQQDDALRKSKKSAAQQVESMLGEYDEDMAAKDAVYQEAVGQYNELKAELDKYTEDVERLREERAEFEALMKWRAEQQRLRDIEDLTRKNAAKRIQAWWRKKFAVIKAERKKAKKEAAAKAGKKGRK